MNCPRGGNHKKRSDHENLHSCDFTKILNHENLELYGITSEQWLIVEQCKGHKWWPIIL